MNKTRNKTRKAQVKIQETAFMLLALAFLLVLVFIFYSNYQLKKLYTEHGKLQSEEAVTLLDKFIALPEFSCFHGNCIDLDKVLSLSNLTSYTDLWQGTSRIEIMQIYPSQKRYLVYQKAKVTIDSTYTYAGFVALCKTMPPEGWQSCTLAKLLISIEKPKQA